MLVRGRSYAPCARFSAVVASGTLARRARSGRQERAAAAFLCQVAVVICIIHRELVELDGAAQTGQQQFVCMAYRSDPDGRLNPMDSCPFLPVHALRPVLVTYWDPARTWRPGKRPAASREAPYLIGPPTASAVDPSLWGIGRRQCHQLVVREAATRLTVLAAFSRGTLLSPRAPTVPAIWEGGGRSLTSLEARWTDRLSTVAEGAQPAQPLAAPTRSAHQALEPDYEVGAPWLRLSPSQRDHWRDRQLNHADLGPQGELPTPHQRLDDLADAAVGHSEVAGQWSAVWARLHHLGLDRQHRLVAWQILHAAIPCGAHTAYTQLRRTEPGQIDALLDSAMCPHCLPERRPETLSHMLLHCPVATQIWAWVGRLWAAYSRAAAPPLSAAVLLADDQRDWQPASHSQATWTQLRIATLTAIRNGANSKRTGMPAEPVSIAAVIVASLRSAMRRDWQRVEATNIASLSSGVCCSTWLRGRHPLLSRQEFTVMWTAHGAFCSVSSDGSRGKLRLVLSLTTPVPFPSEGADAVAS